MLHVIAKSYVKKENHSKFLEIAKELVDETRKEDGCIQYILTNSAEDENILVYVEIWESAAHLKAHTETEHFTRLVPMLDALGDVSKKQVLKLEDAYR